jgi:4'-phosphopantetheinyl transferase
VVESDPMIALAPGDIHLWLAYYDEIDNEELLTAYRNLLNDAERIQERRFYFAKDRRRYLVTRALVRVTLSRYANVRPQEWIFRTNEYGCPAIANDSMSDSGLRFNISHTHSLIVLGVARDCALGVDVENAVAREVSIDIADRFFSPDEVTALARVSREKQKDRFFEYWTFKESYIKARGMGLSIPLDRFSFDLSHDREVALAIHPELGDRAERWRFWQFRPRAEYLVALCAERFGQDAPTPLIIKTVPLQDIDERVDVNLCRTSK